MNVYVETRRGGGGKIKNSLDTPRGVARRCSAGEPLPAGLSAWLGKSLGEFLSHRQRSIEAALGLVWPRGGVPWWLEEAMRPRDAALRQPAQRFFRRPAVSPPAPPHYRPATPHPA